MYVIGSFQHSLKVEIAIGELEAIGILPRDILALPLDVQDSGGPPGSGTTDGYGGARYVELAAILGMIGMLLGAIYGFVLTWGPILWATIGLVTGLLAGGGIRLLQSPAGKAQGTGGQTLADLFLMVRCAEWEAERVKRILWAGRALGVAVFRPEAGTADEGAIPTPV